MSFSTLQFLQFNFKNCYPKHGSPIKIETYPLNKASQYLLFTRCDIVSLFPRCDVIKCLHIIKGISRVRVGMRYFVLYLLLLLVIYIFLNPTIFRHFTSGIYIVYSCYNNASNRDNCYRNYSINKWILKQNCLSKIEMASAYV